MTLLSVLDLAPITEGSDATQSFRNSVEIAQLAERLGYNRYWLAEHHNIPGIASAATAVLLSHVGAHTKTIRIGSGGVMLPNHAPLVIAEQFGTLASLYPDRIDLGLGRAPGTDGLTAQALRRSLNANVDTFPRDVLELQQYFADPEPGQRIQAVPGAGLKVPLWILGSSLYGAEMAAHFGLPYAFASHFAPTDLRQALHVYRQNFKPSAQLDRPYVMAAMNLQAADTREQADIIVTSLMQGVLGLARGMPIRLPPPIEGFADQLGLQEKAAISRFMTYTALGDAKDVSERLREFKAETDADEIILTAQIFDHQARLRAFEIAAEAMSELI
ncbi:LLM class flavin-dependent oxidoreductase [Sneathiella sp. CAU 1612]|uniref:LLM class flavin-dependent oxidoreductase n=1 Tax=Sneathiella sedimenti TaxID=2816034 RepID=A0ABS3F9Y9_9PROT|nr:LLM class flavin-dependent oxidoreductase [Sneathiella sedimenti]MBO0335324.1 LLM class flavin-dependent oxidoreductase [Sneathiella sedimenti]